MLAGLISLGGGVHPSDTPHYPQSVFGGPADLRPQVEAGQRLTSPTAGSCSPSPTMMMQSAWRMQRCVHGVSVESVW